MENGSCFIPKKIDLAVRPRVIDFLTQYPNFSCEYNFINLFCWEAVYQYTWFVYEGRFVIHDGAEQLLFMPLGRIMDPSALHTLSGTAQKMGLSPDICLASLDYLEQFSDLERFYTITRDRDAAEYIYRAKNLAELKGNRLHKKRNLISQFKRKYPDYRILPLTRSNAASVKGFAQDLLEISDPVPKTLADEFCAIKKAIDHWDDLGLDGIVVVVEDKIAAFCVFSQVSCDIANIHFEKSNLAFKGAAQVINQATAQFLQDKTRFINREQDLGILGLRRAKLSYDPDHLIIPYVLRFKDPS